ncbi:MAG: VTT domain-containing protein [Gemmataceae bacterium]|nr:VTT domain-containing protein [Gemmataceae bacterium]
MRILLWTALVWFAWAALASVHADEPQVSAPNAVEPASEDGFWYQLFTSLFDSRKLLNVLKRPEFIVPAFIAVNLIVFVETGLLIGFCLPGDSLLVTVGFIASPDVGNWNLPLLLLTLCISAVVGDSVGYSIGWKTGPRIFNRENSLFFHKDHLLKAQAFYEKHGGKTIIMARFVPIVRTFAPVVAGVGRMEYRRFLMFNIIGGIGWVVSLTVFGYYLPSVIQPLLRPIFGEHFEVQDHLEKVILIVVFVSILPIIIGAIRHKLSSPPSTQGGERLAPLPPSPLGGEGLTPLPPSPLSPKGRGESDSQPLTPLGRGEPDTP